MPFWTVGDAGPYKENLNFLMRSTLCAGLFCMRRAYARSASASGSRRLRPMRT